MREERNEYTILMGKCVEIRPLWQATNDNAKIISRLTIRKKTVMIGGGKC
jgi:hypothetical protein